MNKETIISTMSRRKFCVNPRRPLPYLRGSLLVKWAVHVAYKTTTFRRWIVYHTHTHLRQGGQNNNVVARDLVSDACLEALTVIALILSSIIYTHSPLPCNATVHSHSGGITHSIVEDQRSYFEFRNLSCMKLCPSGDVDQGGGPSIYSPTSIGYQPRLKSSRLETASYVYVYVSDEKVCIVVQLLS